MELLPVCLEIPIIDLAVYAAFLVCRCENDIVIRAAFVGKTDAVAIDLHKRLRAWIPLIDRARELLGSVRGFNISGVYAASGMNKAHVVNNLKCRE